ncbi:Retinoblastoma-related protein 1 [Sarracenia purpurea var. burkii]
MHKVVAILEIEQVVLAKVVLLLVAAGVTCATSGTLEFFLTSDANVDELSVVTGATGCVSDHHRFGWLLFLALRSHAFSHFKDLLTCTNGFIAILKGSKCVDLLASLCNIYETSEDDLRKKMEKANGLIADILKRNPCPASEYDLIYFDGLMEEASLSSSLDILDYADATHNKGELDERLFANEEDSLLGLRSLSGGAMNINGIKKPDCHQYPFE